MFTKEEQALAKPCHEAIKKISKGKWEWEPEIGEWAISEEYTFLIIGAHDNIVEYNFGYYPQKDCVPLLHWERIEEILALFGYELIMLGTGYYADFACGIQQDDKEMIKRIEAPTRQLAVMRAVIELGKE